MAATALQISGVPATGFPRMVHVKLPKTAPIRTTGALSFIFFHRHDPYSWFSPKLDQIIGQSDTPLDVFNDVISASKTSQLTDSLATYQPARIQTVWERLSIVLNYMN